MTIDTAIPGRTIDRPPLIVAIGGTTVAGSTTESALKVALAAARRHGAIVDLFDGPMIARLPHYGPGAMDGSAVGTALVDAVRRADGLIIASPGYHGTISGLVKNALDHLEETARDERAYLDGLPIGLIVTAYGWQATGSTLASLRATAHALRGWPTPLGATIKSAPGLFVDGRCTDAGITGQLDLLGRQVVDFAVRRHGP